MNNLTELIMILDRSGSMCGLEADTVGGFNSLIAKQKKEAGEALVTTVLFDDRLEILHDRIPLAGVLPITEKEYYVRGCTALLDAIGCTITRIRARQQEMLPEARPCKTMVVITTDGFENASREFTYDSLRKLIGEQERQGWEFLFLGANMDAIRESSRFGIHADHAANYCCDSAGTALNYEVLSDAIAEARCQAAPLKAGWKQRIDEDFRKRSRK